MRLRATESQAGLTPRMRRMNVRGAFSVSDPAAVTLKHVLVIDDILTTGATARAAAQALLKAGAASVWVATLARARRVNEFGRGVSFQDADDIGDRCPAMRRQEVMQESKQVFIARPTIFLTRGKEMSLGKAMIHARKQKSIARAAALAGEHTAGQYSCPDHAHAADAGAGAERIV